MPNKSDSSGKLHQYFTCEYLFNKYPQSIFSSQLLDPTIRTIHINLFSKQEIKSLKKIGQLSGDEIIKFMKNSIAVIKDVGVSSGAIGINNTDDITITDILNNKYSFSLKCAKNTKQILSKNMGAKSLINKYFLSPSSQKIFNQSMSKSNLTFLNSVLKTNGTDITLLKKDIENFAIKNGLTKARFADPLFLTANTQRTIFLRELRDNLLSILKKLSAKEILHASNLILDSGKNHIISEYSLNKETALLKIIPMQTISTFTIQSRGNDSVEIILGKYKIGFRFKFESGLTSPIKLVGDYTY